MIFAVALKIVPLLGIFVLCHCNSSNLPRYPEFSLKVSQAHKNTLHILEQEKYDQAKTHEIFTLMAEKGDEVCKMYYEQHSNPKGFDQAKIKEYIKMNLKRNKKEKWYDNIMPALMAGCFNFFTMNDQKVWETFKVVADKFPEKKDCYSVGFMQPYFMHNILNCKRLIMLDINWRILHVHAELLKNMQMVKEEYKSIEQFESIVFNLPVHWVAILFNRPLKKYIEDTLGKNTDDPEKKHKVDFTAFCEKKDLDVCKDTLYSFYKKFRKENLNSVELQLSYLHEIDVQNNQTDTAIIFVSNALDKEYTSRKDFDFMIKSIFNSLTTEKKVIIVYQAGGMELFGIYQLRKDNSKNKVETLCRDNYVWSKDYFDQGKPYRIHLDDISHTRKPPRCR